MLIDTHCHLDALEFADDREAVVHAALTAGLAGIVVPAVANENFAAVRACCQQFSGCYPAYGIHPLYTAKVGEEELHALRSWLSSEVDGPNPPLAVGEIGLDFYYPQTDAARQETIFVEQLKIARDFGLPVLLHVRRAIDQVLKCLRRIGSCGGIAHAFNGSRQQADEFIRLGFKLGFGGAMTFSGSTRIRAVAAAVPLGAVVLETDAPDIPPAWLAGARNSPAELRRIAMTFAELRGLALADVILATGQNARSVLPLFDVARSSGNQAEMPQTPASTS